MPDFDPDELEDIKSRTQLSSIFAQFGVRARGRGAVLFCRCPFHDDRTPSLKIDDRRGNWICFGCNAMGDHFDAVMQLAGVGFVEAVERLGGVRPVSAEDRRRLQERREQIAAEELAEAESLQRSVERVWRERRSLIGTPVEAYLAARAIEPIDLEDVGFATLPYRGFKSADSDETEVLGSFPCMVAAIRDAEGHLIGVHRTYLDPAAPRKLSPPGDEVRNRAKKILGTHRGGMIRLSTLGPRLATGEGIETTLSWGQLGYGGEDIALASAVSLTNLAGRAAGSMPHPSKAGRTIPNGEPDMAEPGMRLPAVVEQLTILGDGDSDPAMTHARLLVAGRRCAHEGRQVFYSMAPGGSDWNDVLKGGVMSGGGIQTLEQFEAAAQTVIKAPRFRARRFQDFMGEVLEDRWVVRGIIPEDATSVVYGPPKTGKSFFCLDMAISVASGRPWWDRRVDPGGVIYVAAEGQSGISKRLKAWQLEHGDPGDIPFIVIPERVNLLRPETETTAFIEEVKGISARMMMPLRLVVIDTVARAMAGGNENSSEDMGAFIENADRIRRATGAAVLMVHHAGKDATKGMRGHSSLLGAVDCQIELSRDETKLITAKLTAQKDEESGERLGFRLKKLIVGSNSYGEDITSCVVVRSEEDERPAKNGPTLKGQARIAYQCLSQALLDYGRTGLCDVIPPKVGAVEWKVWRDYCDNGGLVMSDDDKEKRRAFVSAAKQLRAQGWIGVHDPWVWQAR